MARKHKPEEIIGKLREAEIVHPGRGQNPDRSLAPTLQHRQAEQLARLSPASPGSSNAAMPALPLRYAPPAASHGAGGSFTLTINADHSVGAGQARRG